MKNTLRSTPSVGAHGGRCIACPSAVSAAAVCALVALALLWGSAACGAENFPRPDFTRGETFPEQINPFPRAAWLTYVDLAALVVTLALATLFSLKLRSRAHLFALALFAVAYFGFYRHGCVCAIGAIQNVAYALGANGYKLPLVVGLFFALPLLFALFFGRTFCAGVCPLGALQEIIVLRPVRVPAWLDAMLSQIPFIFGGVAVLYAAVGSTFLICRYDPFIEFFRFGGTLPLLLFGAGLLVLGIFVGRPYCRYVCPLSALLRLAAPLAQWRPRITTGECVNCHLCAQACPYGAIRPPTAPERGFNRRAGRRSLALQLLLLPLFMALGGGLLRLSSFSLAQLDPRVRLAEEVWMQEQGIIQEPTDALEAFGNLEQPNLAAYQRGAAVQKWFDTGSWFLGGWIGLIFGLKLVGMSLRRRRETYSIDVASCVHCGRCYNVCPLTREGAAGDEGPGPGPLPLGSGVGFDGG
ncbi:4Fe-4S binding protein [bacterium]|nr:4Fe-4S binding protein [bacterium]